MCYSYMRYLFIMVLALTLPCFSAYRTQRAKQPEIFKAINDGDIEAMVRILQVAEAPTLNTRGREGETPLHVAVSVGNTLFVELLVNAGANMAAVDDDFCLPLTIAARTGQYDIARILLREPFPINSKNNFQATPLHYACEKGYHEIVRLLVKRYAQLRISVDEPDLCGKTPLHWAAEENKYRTCQIVLRAGSDSYAVDWQRQTPLHVATAKGCYDTVKVLHKYCANNNAEDQNHKTPLDLAVAKGHRKCAHYLLKYGAYVSLQTAAQLDDWENFDWRNIRLAAAKRLMGALESETVRSKTVLPKELNILLVILIYDVNRADFY